MKDYLAPFEQCELILIGPCLKQVPEINEPVIYVDGGAQFRQSSKGFSVGDGDSYSGFLDQRLPKQKNFSDFSFALSQIPGRFTRIKAYGFLGERMDHEFMNLAEAHSFLKKAQPNTEIIFDTQTRGLSNGCWEIEIQGTFSMFVFESCQVQLSGHCEYTIRAPDTLKPLSSHGVSNRGFGKIQIICDKPVFIFYNLKLD